MRVIVGGVEADRLPEGVPGLRVPLGFVQGPAEAVTRASEIRCPYFEPTGATERRAMRQVSWARRSSWVIAAAARMAGGVATSMISSTDRTVA